METSVFAEFSMWFMQVFLYFVTHPLTGGCRLQLFSIPASVIFFQFKFLGHVVNFCLITLSGIWRETYLLTNTLTCVCRIMLESSLSSIKTNIALCILNRAPRRLSEVIFCNTQHLESEIKLILNTKRVFWRDSRYCWEVILICISNIKSYHDSPEK